MSHVLAVIARVLGLAAAAWLAGWLADLGYDRSNGANIGAGLLAFAALIVVSFGWSIRDGWHSRRVGVTIARWLGAGVVLGVLAAFQAQGFGVRGGRDGTVFASDLRRLSPFVFGLVAVPAVLGTLLGAGIGRRRG